MKFHFHWMYGGRSSVLTVLLNTYSKMFDTWETIQFVRLTFASQIHENSISYPFVFIEGKLTSPMYFGRSIIRRDFSHERRKKYARNIREKRHEKCVPFYVSSRMERSGSYKKGETINRKADVCSPAGWIFFSLVSFRYYRLLYSFHSCDVS